MTQIASRCLCCGRRPAISPTAVYCETCTRHTCDHRCGCVLAHKPAQALADLLKAAVEVDEIASIVRVHADLTVEEQRRFNALHAAVRKLQ